MIMELPENCIVQEMPFETKYKTPWWRKLFDLLVVLLG